MRVWYVTVDDILRPKKNTIIFKEGCGELRVYDSVDAAMKVVYKDKLDGWNYPHDTFTFNTSIKENGTVEVVEFDNRHSDWYSDPGVVKTVYNIVPLEIPFEVA